MVRWFAALLVAQARGDDGAPFALGADVPRPLKALAGYLLAGRAGGARLAAGEGLAEVERLIPDGDAALFEAGPNGFVLRATAADGDFLVAVRSGRSSGPEAAPAKGPPGVAHGIFAALEAMGFGFLHPQAVVEPPSGPLRWTQRGNRTETPRLSLRGTHVHTMHPIELTNFLNGFALDGAGGGSGGEDAAWEAGRPDWEAYCAWLVANGQNYVEWMPLEAPEWEDYSTSETRHQRLKSAVDQAHNWGLIVGMDVPVDLGQQHAFKLVKGSCKSADACWKKAQPRLEWILSLGVDTIATEVGSTEVTKGLSGEGLLGLLNLTMEHLASAGKDFLIKNHCSAGQTTKGDFPDPLAPEQNINFNFLNYYADPRIISMPHTVQFYGLNDPVAGSYGNDNFTYLLDWSEFLVENGRPMVYYPETSYWVTSDINVPLFLPIYAKNRWKDLEVLEDRIGELTPDSMMRGQNNFESGWAWGYWLNNAAQARAAWRRSTWPELLESILRPIAGGNAAGAKQLASALDHLIDVQNRTLTYGIGPGEVTQDPRGTPAGMAYMEGWDGLLEIEFSLGITPTQPKRVHPRDLWGLFSGGARKWYHEALAPLLAEMNKTIGNAAREVEDACLSLEADSPGGARAFLLGDLRRSAKLVALRARQQMHLYEAAATCSKRTSSSCAAAMQARQALNEALDVAAQAEHAAVQPERLTDWGDKHWNPTSYRYGYLWPSKRLFYWQRDQEIVEGHEDMCFMNVEDPAVIALSSGRTVQELEHDLGAIAAWVPGLSHLAPCIRPLTEEPFLAPQSTFV